MNSTAYLVAYFDDRNPYEVLGYGIFSEPTPTTYGHRHTIEVASCEGLDYDDAKKNLIKWMSKHYFYKHVVTTRQVSVKDAVDGYVRQITTGRITKDQLANPMLKAALEEKLMTWVRRAFLHIPAQAGFTMIESSGKNVMGTNDFRVWTLIIIKHGYEHRFGPDMDTKVVNFLSPEYKDQLHVENIFSVPEISDVSHPTHALILILRHIMAECIWWSESETPWYWNK